ncbi:2-hydroxyacid dehydrogenase [Rhizocola hellebori]|uniref:2-hydroxyacid dehydrogenase n=1 Tax=Rhizocola hellebori TaxID=1392758 RepID=UPI001944A87C|nr:2-hydroxyacid dehydrogenase [Rhizocola hellebori]
MTVWIAHEQGRQFLGELATHVDIRVLTGPDKPLPSDPAEVTFWVPPFLSSGAVVDFAQRLPSLQVIQLLSAGADAWIGRTRSGVMLCDARGVHDSSTAEWVVTAMLAVLRRFDHFARAQAVPTWSYAEFAPTDELAGKRVLVVGAGSIGTALGARLTPFEVELTYVARTARDGVHAIGELPELLPHADIVVLLVPLTDLTRGMVDATFLAAMRDGALLVNAARGPVADTAALTKELAGGRILAALDVTDPEPLPVDHPLWTMPNVLITPHVAGSVRGLLPRAYRLVGDQLRRMLAGEPLANEVQDGY